MTSKQINTILIALMIAVIFCICAATAGVIGYTVYTYIRTLENSDRSGTGTSQVGQDADSFINAVNTEEYTRFSDIFRPDEWMIPI